jgi:alkanesulfonate monooxygenase SsuD/methylene tetrahydromethanopterin reductase-like flavin-dependent oxidoreductase (luciferase family)
MLIDMFSELQRAQPWAREHEAQVIDDALIQARLADSLGYDCWWSVEHHGAVEFSLSSTPELLNLMVAQCTSALRIGHSGVLSPFTINHPIRVAERTSFLDIVSGGRLEVGLARSAGAEWDAFGVDGGVTRDQMRELFTMLPRMWNDEKFSWDSDLIRIPVRNVVPKPVQRPHPRLWQTCTSADAFRMAGELGVGALGVTLLTPLDNLETLHQDYRDGLASCVAPAGDTVNDQFGIFTFVHCAATREEAIRSRAAESVLWYVNRMPQVFETPRKLIIDGIRGVLAPGAADAWATTGHEEIAGEMDPEDPVPVIRLLNRQALGYELDPEEAFEVLEPMDSMVIGDVDACLTKIRKYVDLGVARLLCFQQYGWLSQDDVLGSIRRIGEEILPAVSASP